MAMDFNKMRDQVKTRNEQQAQEAAEGQNVRTPQPIVSTITLVETAPEPAVLHVKQTQPPVSASALPSSPATETDNTVIKIPTRTAPSRKQKVSESVLEQIVSRRDPITSTPTVALHFHIDIDTEKRIREVSKALRRERVGNLYLTSLLDLALTNAIADPVGWRDMARALPPIKGNAEPLRVQVSSDLRQQLEDIADEYLDDDQPIPMARLARVALAMTLDKVERTLGI